VQLYALVLPQFVTGAVGEQSVVSEWKTPLWTVLEIAHSFEASLSGGLLVLVAGAAVLGLGVISFARDGRQQVVLQLLVIPCLLCAGVNVALGHHLWPRFFFFAAGFGVLVAVRGILRL